MTTELSPILRFADTTPEASFGRVGDDPFPFLGKQNSLLTEEERLERRGHKVLSYSRVFDAFNPSDMKEYNGLIDRQYSGWFSIFHNNVLFDEEERYIFTVWGVNYNVEMSKSQFNFNRTEAVRALSPTDTIFHTAIDLVTQITGLGENKGEVEDEETTVRRVKNYYTDSGIFDILDAESMARFHVALDSILAKECLCDCIKIQYDQEKRKIFMVWVAVKETEIELPSNQGWRL